MIRRFAIATVIACVAAGCSRPSPTPASAGATAPAAAAGTPKVAVVISTLNNPWFVVLGETAKARAEELGYEATIFNSENDTAKEASHFENALAGGYQAILFNATDSDGSIANVRKAKAAGVPVFCIDREINATDAATSQILSDNHGGCVALGQAFVEQLGEKGTYVEILGYLGDNNAHNRSRGFHEVVDSYPELKMVAQQAADFDRAKALEVMETLLQKHGDGIDAVFCGNDSMAMGAYQAISAAGRDDVKVFGFDGADEVVRLIAAGKIAATGMQFPKKMARQAAEYADAWIKGQRDFPQKVPVAVEVVTADNVGDYGDYGAKDDARPAPN
jgi:ribose transport system substrate-binding protein